MQAAENEKSGMSVYLAVYAGILALAGLQIVIAYQHLETGRLLFRMLSVAVVQAGLALLFFMHLRYERRSLLLALVPTTVFVLLMMNAIWTDSFRLLHLRPFAH